MRFLLAAIGAPLISFALFIFMASLINNQVSLPKDTEENSYFDLVMSQQDESFQSKHRQKPKPPEPKPQVSAVPSPSIKPVMQNPGVSASLDMPAMDLSRSVSARSISMPGIESALAPLAHVGDTIEMPLYRVEPRYPAKALRLGKQGYVILSFDINEAGRVVNIQILEAKPKRLFERDAKRALKKWKYKPTMVNGQAVKQLGQKIRLDFKLES